MFGSNDVIISVRSIFTCTARYPAGSLLCILLCTLIHGDDVCVVTSGAQRKELWGEQLVWVLLCAVWSNCGISECVLEEEFKKNVILPDLLLVPPAVFRYRLPAELKKMSFCQTCCSLPAVFRFRLSAGKSRNSDSHLYVTRLQPEVLTHTVHHTDFPKTARSDAKIAPSHQCGNIPKPHLMQLWRDGDFQQAWLAMLGSLIDVNHDIHTPSTQAGSQMSLQIARLCGHQPVLLGLRNHPQRTIST